MHCHYCGTDRETQAACAEIDPTCCAETLPFRVPMTTDSIASTLSAAGLRVTTEPGYVLVWHVREDGTVQEYEPACVVAVYPDGMALVDVADLHTESEVLAAVRRFLSL